MSAFYYDDGRAHYRWGFFTRTAALLALLLTVGLAYVTSGYIREAREERNLSRHEADAAATAAIPVGALGMCMTLAAETYQVPSSALAGILRVEGGHMGQAVANRNGTFDLGPMQINSLWVPQLARLWHVDNATAWRAVRDNGCENIYIAAWILKQKTSQTGSLYDGIANYHSATRRFGLPYASKVVTVMEKTPPAPPYLGGM